MRAYCKYSSFGIPSTTYISFHIIFIIHTARCSSLVHATSLFATALEQKCNKYVFHSNVAEFQSLTGGSSFRASCHSDREFLICKMLRNKELFTIL
jgi:hypothetical protein